MLTLKRVFTFHSGTCIFTQNSMPEIAKGLSFSLLSSWWGLVFFCSPECLKTEDGRNKNKRSTITNCVVVQSLLCFFFCFSPQQQHKNIEKKEKKRTQKMVIFRDACQKDIVCVVQKKISKKYVPHGSQKFWRTPKMYGGKPFFNLNWAYLASKQGTNQWKTKKKGCDLPRPGWMRLNYKKKNSTKKQHTLSWNFAAIT